VSVSRLQAVLKREARSSAREVERCLAALAGIHARQLTGTGPLERTDAVTRELSRALSMLGALADLSGRLDVRFPDRGAPIEAEAFASRGNEIPEIVPRVAFVEAIQDLQSRDPFGAEELERFGLAVEDAYAPFREPSGELFYPHSFSAARALDEEVATRVRDRIAQGMAEGHSTPAIVADLSSTWDWPKSYASTVTRAAVATATTAGRFVEGERVAAAGIPVGFVYMATRDSNVRRGRPEDHGENHLALDGLRARVDDPVWDSFSPPLGFGCRCSLSPIVGSEVPEGFVSVPNAARAAPGFGHRPDRQGRQG